jgi:serine/threonine protein kinase
MKESENCPQCGRLVPADAPGGHCPACLLRQALPPGAPPGSAGQAPDEQELSRLLPQFTILERIGSGGMGWVYRVRQRGLERLAALKIMAPGLATDPAFVERFTREGQALARLQHPNIVSVYDFGETGGFCWLLMEYVDGVNLRQVMASGGLSPAEALRIIPEVCAALGYAHGRGVLHRDIKPENILLDAAGRVKIADFGVARLCGGERAGSSLTQSGVSLGTPVYMAPEQIERPQDVDHRADIYSLGVVFYEMLTGGLPLGRFPAPSETPGVDDRLDPVVFRTLEKQRERRYQTAGEMQTQVEAVQAGPSPVPPADAPAATAAAETTAAAEPATQLSREAETVRISWKAIAGMLCTITGILMLLGGLLLWRPTGVRVHGAASPQLHFETIKPD